MQETLLEGFRKSSRGEERGGASPHGPCAMPACALACVNPWRGKRGGAKDRVKYFQCAECKDGPDGEEGWFYLTCVGLGLTEYEDDDFYFCCPVCDGEVSGPGDVVPLLVKNVDKQKGIVKKLCSNILRWKKLLMTYTTNCDKLIKVLDGHPDQEKYKQLFAKLYYSLFSSMVRLNFFCFNICSCT